MKMKPPAILRALECVLIRREPPWRPQIKPVHDLPLIFSARIESRDELCELDQAGRYRYRQYPDSNNAPHAEDERGTDERGTESSC